MKELKKLNKDADDKQDRKKAKKSEDGQHPEPSTEAGSVQQDGVEKTEEPVHTAASTLRRMFKKG